MRTRNRNGLLAGSLGLLAMLAAAACGNHPHPQASNEPAADTAENGSSPYPTKLSREEYLRATNAGEQDSLIVYFVSASYSDPASSRNLLGDPVPVELSDAWEVKPETTSGFAQFNLVLLRDGTYMATLKTGPAGGDSAEYNRQRGHWKMRAGEIGFEGEAGDGLPADIGIRARIGLDEKGDPALIVHFSHDIVTAVGGHLVPMADRRVVLRYVPGRIEASLWPMPAED